MFEIDLFSVLFWKIVLCFGLLHPQKWYLWLFYAIFVKIQQNKSRNFSHLAQSFEKKHLPLKEVISKTEETMAVNPNYEQIGKAFTQQYYALFDNAAQRPQLAALYNVRKLYFFWIFINVISVGILFPISRGFF